MEKEPTNKEIMGAIGELHEAIGEFSNRVDTRFEKMESRMGSMEGRMDSMESKMVTKEYLDEKLFDLRGDLLTVMRKEDRKVDTLIETLYKKDVLNKKDTEFILKIEPFLKAA